MTTRTESLQPRELAPGEMAALPLLALLLVTQRTGFGATEPMSDLPRILPKRASGAETALSRSPGAGLVLRMRENAALALIRPVEASALGLLSRR